MSEHPTIGNTEYPATGENAIGFYDGEHKFIRPRTTITFTKKTPAYIDESALKSLVETGILQAYELKRSGDGSEVTLTF
jgi:hypothetical protein